MASYCLFYFFIFIICSYPLLTNSSDTFNPNDYELFGPTLAANNRFIIAVKSRVDISFSAIMDFITTTPTYCTFTYQPPSTISGLFVTMIAIEKISSSSNSVTKFVFIGYAVDNITTYFHITQLDFSACSLTILNQKLMFNTAYPSYSVLGVNSIGTVAFYLSDTNIFIKNLNSPYTSSNWSAIQFNPASILFLPAAIDLEDNWGLLGAYIRQPISSSQFQATLYLINFPNCLSIMNPTCFTFPRYWQISYSANWQSFQVPSTNILNFGYNSLYSMSISINNNNNVLFGVQSINTVYLLTASSSTLTFTSFRYRSTLPSVGFGRGVGWLDNTTGAILLNNLTTDYIQWRSSTIELYPITNSNSFSNSISPYSSYPNAAQPIWSQLNPHLVNSLAIPSLSALIYMDYNGQVHIIRPNNPGYFVYTVNGIGQVNNTIYIAPTLSCASGTIKNLSAYGKDLFRYCLLCPAGSFYSANSSNNTNKCLPCDPTTQFCPWGAVAALPISVLDTQSQAQVYPQSPDNDNFEDILLTNMFSVDFSSDCISKQPLFYTIIIIGIGCLVLVFMGILKLTQKCKKQRRMIKKVFKQTDLIGEGELWIGGVASFAIVVVAIFAYRFSNDFINQYPIETTGESTFACDKTLINSKFSTSMQSLGTPFLEKEQPIVDMLNNQSFTLNVAFINTDFSPNQLKVSQVLGSILVDLPQETTTTEGILQVSTDLPSHSTTIQFNVSSNSALGGFRVGLTGPSMVSDNYYVQELNFSYAFYYINRTTTQNPLITIELIKLINTTEPLSSTDDEKQYSAIWIPTFIKNDDQLFYNEEDFFLYHTEENTILTVQLTEATYYISNQQEPITKLTKVIFTDILFTTMCIELFALTFLFYKLALSPVAKILISLCFKSKKIQPKENGDSGPGCPYCRSINTETLPAYRVPVQRNEQNTPVYPIRRQTPDFAKLHNVSTAFDLYD